MEKRHRIFIAINLPEEVKRELYKFGERFTPNPVELGEWAKWTSKDNLHITLEFLGDLTDQELAEVCLITKEVNQRHANFSLNISKIIYGPSHLRSGQAPKFVWAVGEKSKELAELKEDLEKSLLEKVSFIPDGGRGFAPHITLARINSFVFRQINPEEAPEMNESVELIFTVESIEVMESKLHRGGPVYTMLESCPLKD